MLFDGCGTKGMELVLESIVEGVACSKDDDVGPETFGDCVNKKKRIMGDSGCFDLIKVWNAGKEILCM